MANYYRSNVQLSSILKITTLSSGSTLYNFGITNTTPYTSAFLNTVNEKPATLNYSIGGVDISNNSIAYWVEGTSSAGAVSIPSWATKIRAVLVGAGGTGGASTQQSHVHQAGVSQNNHQNNNQNDRQQTDNQRQNQHFSYDPNTLPNQYDSVNHNSGATEDHHNDNHNHTLNTPAVQNDASQGGGGGGGGGFIYLSDFTLSPLQIQMQAGATGATVLTIGAGQNVFTAGAGGNGSGATVGIAGTVQTTPSTGATTTTTVGQAGSVTAGGQSGIITYSTSITNGRGGAGGAAISSGTNPGNSGNSGYYRIYFLTN